MKERRKIATLNRFGVDRGIATLALHYPPRAGEPIPMEDALNLAAHLVAAIGDTERFQQVLAAVEESR